MRIALGFAAGFLATVAAISPAIAQEPPSAVPLAESIGNLHPGTDWTVLRGADLAAESRPTDPQEEPARSLLVSICKTLAERKRTDRHVLLHQLGMRPTQVRILNSYSEPIAMPAAELLSPESKAKFRDDFAKGLASPDAKLEVVDERTPELFATTKCLALGFRTTANGETFCLDYYFVPSGPRLAYFESVYLPGDAEARTAAEAVLRTFDGAVDPAEASSLLKSMTIGGITGAIAGIFAAMLRRRLQARAAANAAAS
jgi:hypothetical protein